MDIASYDFIIVAFSGGKDSLACVLHLLDIGVSPIRIELWHHDVDGQEGSTMMDWTCTRDYCRKFAQALGMPIYYSWKVGGFEREMTRVDAPTAATRFEVPGGETWQAGGLGRPGTRGLFPQVSPDLSVRWCSAYLKIDPMSIAIRNQPRFLGRRTLVITGERAEESSSRAKYLAFEPDRTDNRSGRSGARRHVDHWRPVHAWTEQQVWALIEKHRINPHPAYRLGFGRVSCAGCIFGNADQFASHRVVNPEKFQRQATYEGLSGKTIKRKVSLVVLADSGKPYEMDERDIAAARSETFNEPIILEEGAWKLPRGAFGDSCGPT